MARLTWRVIQRELALTWRRRSTTLGGLLFFVMAASLFPFAVGPDPALLRTIAPGVLWVTALFAAMLSAGHLFGQDFASGALEQMLLSPQPLAGIVLGKVVAHWLTSGLALVLLAPVVALQYALGPRDTLSLMGSLLLGTPLLSLIGSMGAALTLGVRGGGVTLALLILPLYVPVLIFGVGAADPGAAANWTEANFSLLGAALCVAGWLCPWASAAALRIALE
ncbi:heme exporter protein CcmB [Paraburkholderia sp. DHOC27]|uniref:heme exporter protein CcmB n=1 Tax=Paraburkholderia sp. DHOC27 TaxID=2303330 RepID=UPI000E3EC9C1|nr:heme exporter protein CcmB [Paraburkholderia sp. DHOC27]RFU49011.1 heme exporter protein CcmB [Paraburkholderia sp. DHOC27]